MRGRTRTQERKPATARGAKKTQPGPQAFYVYCIGETSSLAPMVQAGPPESLERDAALELITGDNDLAAIVSAVPIAEYGEERFQERLADPAWTAVRALRHEAVVEHFAARASIIPLRFGTVFYRRARVAQMLARKQARLLEIIARLRGRQEWGVNVYYDRARLAKRITSISPRLRDLGEQAEAASPGRSYLIRKKIEALRAEEVGQQTGRVVAEVEEALASVGESMARLRVLKDESTERGEVAAKLAFLVAHARFDEFRAEAERLAQKHADEGFQLELTGPWPAYNFAATKS